ncbi:acyltransferase family protein [Methanofollis ethanolicus]|uniref:acyltransferase family protein n=1 Tax=Methanofollis ethanolicus TaxID=488124 RepID=UPI000830EBB9|nr:acyltransferase [Methanofollis ethanolicus]
METSRRHANNFDFLRLSAALVIIVSHAYALQIGYGAIPGNSPAVLVGQAALASLFVTSGYLIPQSWMAQPDVKRFFWKRSLRVFPALVPALIFTFLLIGPVATTLPLTDYVMTLLSPFTLASFGSVWNGSALGLFQSNPVTFVNASLWTIPVEFVMYILVALLGVAGLLRRKDVLLALIAIDFAIWMVVSGDPGLAKVRFTLYFLIGAYLAVHHPDHRYDPRTAAVLAVVLVAASQTPYVLFLAFVAVPYIVLAVAHLGVPAMNRFGNRGDFSYGIYIYAYPIQQMIVLYLGTSMPLWLFSGLSVLLTFPLAYASWHLVEKKALALKQIGFGEGTSPFTTGQNP